MAVVAELKEEVFCVAEAEGVSVLQCCWWGEVGDVSVVTVQWLWGCGCIGMAGVSLAA